LRRCKHICLNPVRGWKLATAAWPWPTLEVAATDHKTAAAKHCESCKPLRSFGMATASP
jgi:hypothetical protein